MTLSLTAVTAANQQPYEPDRGSCDPQIDREWEEQPDERPVPIELPEEEPVAPEYVPEEVPAYI